MAATAMSLIMAFSQLGYLRCEDPIISREVLVLDQIPAIKIHLISELSTWGDVASVNAFCTVPSDRRRNHSKL
jgi:hypothetical protein